MKTASIVGDSQSEGLEDVLEPILARHGYELDRSKSWTQSGAGIDAITEHARTAGPVGLMLIFTGGGNDSSGLVNNQNAYRAKLETLVGTARFSGAQNVVLVGPFISDDPAVQSQHEAARLVQGRGIPGARWIDGFPLTRWIPHPPNNPTHWDARSYARIGLELEKSLFESGEVTAIGLVGTLAFLAAGGVVIMELLYARAAGDVG